MQSGYPEQYLEQIQCVTIPSDIQDLSFKGEIHKVTK